MTLKESPPNRSLSKGAIFVLTVLVISALLFIYFVFQPKLVPGQALVDIKNIEMLRERFNADMGKTRLILIASPT